MDACAQHRFAVYVAEPVFVLQFIAIHLMAASADCHQVFDSVSSRATTHPSALDVVNVCRLSAADLARNEIAA